jgi:putative membrane protein
MKFTQLSMLSLAVAASFAFVSCSGDRTDNNTQNEDPKETAEEHNEAKFETNKSEEDAQFVVEAADINLAEASLGKLAATNAMSQEVRELGDMMTREHQKAYDELVALAKKKNITVPASVSDNSQKKYNDLSEKKGTDFDKQFCDAMVDGHKDAIDKFEKASKESTDPDIQTWATNMLPSLRQHLDHSVALQEKVKEQR